MSDEQKSQIPQKLEIDDATNPDGCTRCGGDADAKMGIGANRDDALLSWHGLCDDCLRELGDWCRADTEADDE